METITRNLHMPFATASLHTDLHTVYHDTRAETPTDFYNIPRPAVANPARPPLLIYLMRQVQALIGSAKSILQTDISTLEHLESTKLQEAQDRRLYRLLDNFRNTVLELDAVNEVMEQFARRRGNARLTPEEIDAIKVHEKSFGDLSRRTLARTSHTSIDNFMNDLRGLLDIPEYVKEGRSAALQSPISTPTANLNVAYAATWKQKGELFARSTPIHRNWNHRRFIFDNQDYADTQAYVPQTGSFWDENLLNYISGNEFARMSPNSAAWQGYETKYFTRSGELKAVSTYFAYTTTIPNVARVAADANNAPNFADEAPHRYTWHRWSPHISNGRFSSQRAFAFDGSGLDQISIDNALAKLVQKMSVFTQAALCTNVVAQRRENQAYGLSANTWLDAQRGTALGAYTG